MKPSKPKWKKVVTNRQIFSGIFHTLACLTILVVAVALLSGANNFLLYLQNDLLPIPQKTLFVLGLLSAYILSLVIISRTSPLPSFDFFNRVVVTTLVCFSLYGFILAISRIGIFSRTLFIVEAVTTAALLLGYFSLRLKWFPPKVGITGSMQDRFSHYSTIQWVVFDPLLPPPRDLDMLALGETADKVGINPIAESVLTPRIPVIAESDIDELLSGRVALSKITATLLIQLKPPRLYFAVKRAGELALSLILTPVIAISCLVLGALIKIDSPGPVFFRQTRIGLNGSQFRIIKLRTMSHQSVRSGEDRFAEPSDQRITRVGRWLRHYRLDELPQFWNIVRGEMSLIGPRPEQPSFVDQFAKTIPLYLLRHAVRPGITGWAQVRYGYAASEEQTRTKLEYDLFYIKHMSVWLDFNIFLSTLHTVLLKKGAR